MSQNRSAMSRVEDFLQGSVEGFFNRLFRSGLQREEIARRLERALDENIVVANGKRSAPNQYRVLLSQTDFAKFQSFARLLQRQLQEGLAQVAQQRGYTMQSAPVVTLEVDPHLGKGDLRVETSFADSLTPTSALGGNAGLAGVAPDFTQVVTGGAAAPDGSPAGAAVALPTAALVLRTPQGPGQSYPLNREVIHIGRHKSNDIVIKEEKISRYHAEIRYERGQFVLYDLGSLNGVLVNGVLTRQTILRPGDIIGIGSYSFVFERR
jgi:hypothetical protein